MNLMNQEVKERLATITTRVTDAGVGSIITKKDVEWLLLLVNRLGVEIDRLTSKQEDYDRLLPVASSARGLMVDLGRGSRDLTFHLAEMHNSLRVLDGKDYLSSKPGIIIA